VSRSTQARELRTLLATTLAGGLTFGGLAALVHSDGSLGADRRALRFGNDIRTGTLDDLAKLLTHLGDLVVIGPLVLAAAVYLFARRDVLEGATVLAGMALTYAGVHIAKAAEGRLRPADPLVATTSSAFPSGHAAYAVALIAVAVAFRHALPGLARRPAVVVAAVALAALVGATRIYLRAHWMTDVVAGQGLALALFSACGLVALIVAFIRNNPARA
jgi:membrane-associated phospholipid phosphatase